MLREPVELSMVGAHVAFDGQRLRGSMDRAAKSGGVHMLSACVVDSGFVVSSAAVAEKSNEIAAMQAMVQALDLRGATVTADAMHCQRETAAAIVDAGAQHVLHVKANQPNLLEQCESLFAEVPRRRRPGEAHAVVDQHKDAGKGHGRIETRKVIVSRDLSAIDGAREWRNLAAVAAILREREDVISGAISREISSFICSQGQSTAKEIGEFVRGSGA
ncbi:MAG: ISAs1 family transposase [Deltaproteobacteria bacterium]|nr:ISAs1 family transposase [Deltaproteobacteria bacterium]